MPDNLACAAAPALSSASPNSASTSPNSASAGPNSASAGPEQGRARRARPFLKWAGGKQQLLRQYQPLFPARFAGYLEPFVGSGAVFFDLWSRGALGDGVSPNCGVTLCDVNPELIVTYEVVRDEVDALIEQLREHARAHNREYYDRIRSLDRSSWQPSRVEQAARTIYLNKTCYNGLYRVNRKGYFNVPIGRYARPAILQEETLRAASQALQGVSLRVGAFTMVLELARPGDFVYLDPPYVPLSSTANFTAYTRHVFGAEEQRRLAEVFRELDRRGCLLMLSNSSAPLVHELYAGFHMHTVQAGRAINSRVDARGTVQEVVVVNY